MERCQVSDWRFIRSSPMAFIHKFNWQTAQPKPQQKKPASVILKLACINWCLELVNPERSSELPG